MTLRHRCDKNGCYLATLPDWAILRGCCPRGIEPTDVDGLIEIGGHFLLLEWKRPGAGLTTGQHLTFEALRRTGYFTVLVIWGIARQPQEILVFAPQGIRPRRSCDLFGLQEKVSEWADECDSHRIGKAPVAL
jgi:hypothetical protein